jgi:hypothetical protein
MVALTVRVSCRHVAPAPGCWYAHLGKYGSLITDPNRPPHCEQRPQAEVVLTSDQKIMPGKSVELYGELPGGRQLAGCHVTDVRGRERRWFEF